MNQSSTNVGNPQNQDASNNKGARQAAVNGLAVVGFVALVVFGIALAIYSARYVPQAVTKLATLSGTSTTPNPSLAVVPATTTIPFSAIPEVMTPTQSIPNATQSQNSSAPAGYTTQSSQTRAPAEQQPAFYGLPDLSVTITAVGYLAGDTTDTFVPATVIPPGAHPAVKFIVNNVGTNISPAWTFNADIPSATGPVFNSPLEPPIAPKNGISFTLGFNQTVPGNQVVSIVVDPNDQIQEYNKANNVETANIEVGGPYALPAQY